MKYTKAIGDTHPSRKAAKVPLVIVALVAIITFGMTACGGGGGPSGDPVFDPETMILITFNSNDGSFQTATQAATKGKQVTLEANTWTRYGYLFLGWSSQSGDSNVMERPDEQTFTAGQSDMSLFAVWYRLADIPNSFTSISALGTFLDTLPANSATSPYPLVVNISDFGIYPDSLSNALYVNNTKYVSLDLSGSSFTSIPANALDGNNLIGITIPNSVTSIDRLGRKLTSITFLSAGITIADDVFLWKTGDRNPADPDLNKLKTAYEKDGAGTYTTTAPVTEDSVWVKQ